MDFPMKLYRRKSWAKGEVVSGFVQVDKVENGRVTGRREHCLFGFPGHTKELEDNSFNVKLQETPDGKGMFNLGSDSGKSRWYFADAGLVPKKDE